MVAPSRSTFAVFVSAGLVFLLGTGCEPGYLGPGSPATGREPGLGGVDDDPPSGLRLMDGGTGDLGPRPDSGPGAPPPPPQLDAGPGEPPPPPPPPGPTPYPTGPYGFSRGDTMESLRFTEGDGSAMTFADLRSDLSVKVIVWISSVEWCGSCRDAVPELNRIQSEYGSQGMAMVESLYQDYDYNPANAATVRRWESDLNPNYPTLVEPDPAYAYHANPATWVIDAETMRVLDYGEGVESFSLSSTIEDALRGSSR